MSIFAPNDTFWTDVMEQRGALNDRWFRALGDLGYTGGLSKRLYDWLEDRLVALLLPVPATIEERMYAYWRNQT